MSDTGWDSLAVPRIAPTGFREYDLRWRYPGDINLAGMEVVGRGIGAQMLRHRLPPAIVLGSDFRAYAPAVKQALVLGLIRAGITVHDIGTVLSPMAYFARMHLGLPAVAMVTASHNPNGWTGVKVGFGHPLTHGPAAMAELRAIILNADVADRDGGGYRIADITAAYLEDTCGGFRLKRPLRIVCATGNGTAGAFAPALLARIGAEVIPLHTMPDHSFPHYNPNPEALVMLDDMARALRASGADLALGFDGDGDRCGVIDDSGDEIPSDKMGLLLARDWVADHPGAHFVADVKSTGLFAADPVLRAAGATTEYWKTGHSHMKARVAETRALAGFEKSGHYYFGAPIGHGYDCGLKVAVEICRLLDRHPGQSLAQIHRGLPRTYTSPTMSPDCPDTEKYGVLHRIAARLADMAAAGARIGGQRISGIVTVNGARVLLENGGWGLVRASSNTPNLVVVCESPASRAELQAIFADLDAVIRREPAVGAYDQSL